MEQATFTSILEKPSSLLNESKENLAGLVEKFPYATLVRLAKARSEDALSDRDLQKMLVYFDHPLRLARTLSVKRTGADASKEMKHTDKTADEQVLETVQPEGAQKKKTRLAGIQTKNTAAVTPIEDKQDETAAKAEAHHSIEKQVEPKLEEAESIKKDADVLELINKLPEENPIKKEVKVNKAAEIESKTNDSQTSEDPRDLMVMMSFTDWLHHFKAKSENEAEEKKGKDAIRSAWQKEKLAEAMDDEEDVVPDKIFEKAMKSVSFGDGLVTEPLAELYVQQGKAEKAIELYKKLSLLNPEKRSYFASRIKDLHLSK